jgi:hypothetical protein
MGDGHPTAPAPVMRLPKPERGLPYCRPHGLLLAVSGDAKPDRLRRFTLRSSTGDHALVFGTISLPTSTAQHSDCLEAITTEASRMPSDPLSKQHPTIPQSMHNR